jgi:hypothetical protein
MVDAVPLDDDILPTSNLLSLRGQLDHQYEQIKAFVTENESLADFDFTLFDSKIHSDQKEIKPETSVDFAQKTTSISESEFKVPRRVKKNKRRTHKKLRFTPATKPVLSPKFVTKASENFSLVKPSTPSEYCYCKQDKMDAMIGCDHPNCELEWFHYSCVGITKPPTEDEKWY